MHVANRIKNKTFLISAKTYIRLKLMKLVLSLAGVKDQTIEYDRANKDLNVAAIVDEFHKLYYSNKLQTFDNTYWFGRRMLKCPLDAWVYQDIIYKTRPDLIIETGTNHGGSALFMAHLFDLLDSNGRIITVDIIPRPDLPQHNRITYYIGNSVSKETREYLQREITEMERKLGRKPTVMVILDSNHTRDHVMKELEIYSNFISLNNYLIVEDSNINGHPVMPESGPGPMEAIIDFIAIHDGQFVIDHECEKFFLTFNPNGYLRRVK